MFNAGTGSGFGLSDGLGGVYAEDVAERGSAQRRADALLSCGDVFRCALFFGPALLLWGCSLLVRSGTPMRRRHSPAQRGAHAPARRQPSCASHLRHNAAGLCTPRVPRRAFDARAAPQIFASADPERHTVREYNAAVRHVPRRWTAA
jgi:hypothetical protein